MLKTTEDESQEPPLTEEERLDREAWRAIANKAKAYDVFQQNRAMSFQIQHGDGQIK
jgi:hypothetical protein